MIIHCIEKLFNQLYDWAGKNSLLKHHPESIVIHYDDPELTPEDKQRMNVCITVPEDTEVNGSIGKTTIPYANIMWPNLS